MSNFLIGTVLVLLLVPVLVMFVYYLVYVLNNTFNSSEKNDYKFLKEDLLIKDDTGSWNTVDQMFYYKKHHTLIATSKLDDSVFHMCPNHRVWEKSDYNKPDFLLYAGKAKISYKEVNKKYIGIYKNLALTNGKNNGEHN